MRDMKNNNLRRQMFAAKTCMVQLESLWLRTNSETCKTDISDLEITTATITTYAFCSLYFKTTWYQT